MWVSLLFNILLSNFNAKHSIHIENYFHLFITVLAFTMSSWKKAAKAGQKTHRERHQPESREQLGLLEKKKDYIARARNYQEKQQTLKLLRKRALDKNPDEFYYHMINSQIQGGVHKDKRKQKNHTPEQIKLMETQDIKYIAHKRNIEAKKIDKLQSELHMIDAANKVKNKHTFFVDDSTEAKNFDVAKRLDTHPALLNRRTNRPRLSTIKNLKLPELDDKSLKVLESKKQKAYTQLQKRINRERQLTIVQQKLETKRALKDEKVTKPKLVSKETKNSASIYKWKFERKR